MQQEEVDKLAKIIWDYGHMNQPLRKADIILVLGNYDLRVAEYAAKLFLDGWAPLMVFSGKSGRLTSKIWSKPEAEMFADVAKKMGVPDNKIIIENRSTNTGENILFTRKLFEDRGIKAQKFILVQIPFAERRAYATFKKRWPEKDVIAAPPPMSFDDYSSELVSKAALINNLVSGLRKMKAYPELGYQIPQEIPPNVWAAYEKLVALGFDKQLIK